MTDRQARYAETYRAMAKFDRPGAPGDGMGNVNLTIAQIKDRDRLNKEAQVHAEEFATEEDGLTFWVGCGDFETNRAFFWTIEAAGSASV